jgi:hypothetical protein
MKPERRAATLVLIATLATLAAVLAAVPALAHGIGGKDAAYVTQAGGLHLVPFFYLGAKHMATGYDHLLFVLAVIFYLHRLTHVALYVTMFSVGHSITLLAGVLLGIRVDPFLVDAVIGLSVAYQAFDNLGGLKALTAFRPDTRLMVLGFGLVHGFGLAAKVQELSPSGRGLVGNMLAFNVGVEAGQLLVLALWLAFMLWWRRGPRFAGQAVAANLAILTAGFVLAGYQVAGYLMQGSA